MIFNWAIYIYIFLQNVHVIFPALASIYDKGSRWAPIEKEHHLNHPPPWLWVQHVNFRGWIGRYIEIPYELVVLYVGDEKLPMLPVGFLSLIRHQNKDQIDGNYPQGIKGINTFLRNGKLLLPRCSIHGIFACIWLKFLVNTSKYSIHGADGFEDTKTIKNHDLVESIVNQPFYLLEGTCGFDFFWLSQLFHTWQPKVSEIICRSPPEWHFIFRLGNLDINLYLPRLHLRWAIDPTYCVITVPETNIAPEN